MTLVLGLVSNGGLLLVSDSQATVETTGQSVAMPYPKIYAPWRNVAWGASGPGGITQQVRDHLTTSFADAGYFLNKTKAEIRGEITGQVILKVREVLGQAIQIRGSIQPLLTAYLFVGLAQDGPFIVEVHQDLTHTDHVEVGYAAIGSGDIFPYFALASLQHFNVRQRTLTEAKLIGYRVVQDAISVAAFGLGPPVQVIEIPLPQTAEPIETHRLSNDDIRVLEESVIAWKVVESEALTQFVGLRPAPPAGGEPPVA